MSSTYGLGNLIGAFVPGKAPEHPMLTKAMLKFAADEQEFDAIAESSTFMALKRAASFAAEMGKISLHLAAMRYTASISDLESMALPAAVAELFGYRISKQIDIRVAPVEIFKQEPTNSKDFVKERRGIWILSRRVENSIPIFHLKNALRVPQDLQNPVSKNIPGLQKNLDDIFRCSATLGSFDKSCPIFRLDYDFPEEYETDSVVLGAARWNSDERLLTYAFRALFYFSYPHSSNVLVDTEGNLTLIDHEKIIYRADTSDIKELYESVCGSERVMNACRQISGLSENAIMDALSDIDEKCWQHEKAAFKEPIGASDYFIKRLHAWKRYFKPMVSSYRLVNINPVTEMSRATLQT